MSIPTTVPICLGTRYNAQQGQVGIPGGPSGDDPGLLYLESSDSSATKSGLYVWADSTGALRYHTSKPTNEDGDGSVLATSASSGANRYMNNLLATAINTSLISDTGSTDDLGSSSIYWANSYIDKMYVNSGAYLDGSTANKIKITASSGIEVGVDGTGYDFTHFGATSGSKTWWDESADSWIFDDSQVDFTDGTSTFTFSKVASNALDFDAGTANETLNIGSSTATDVVFHGTNAGQDIQFDSSADSLIALDNAVIAIGSGSDVVIKHDGTDTHIDGKAANEVLRIGDGATIDLWLHGATYDAYWDASADEMIFKDSAMLSFGTGSDFTIEYNASDLLIEAAAANDGMKFGATTNFDLYIYGQTATNYIQFDTDDSALDMILTNFAIVYNDTNVDYTLAETSDILSLTATDHASAKLILGGTGTNGMDIDILSATASDGLYWVASGSGKLSVTDAEVEFGTGATLDVNSTINLGGLIVADQTAQTLTGAGAVNVTSTITWVVTTGADALTLADGSEGQFKYIVMKTDGGDGTLTPTNLGNGTTITFDDVGDCAFLLFTNAAWHMIGGTATLA